MKSGVRDLMLCGLAHAPRAKAHKIIIEPNLIAFPLPRKHARNLPPLSVENLDGAATPDYFRNQFWVSRGSYLIHQCA